MPANHKENIERALNDLREAHKAQDMNRIDTTSQALNDAWAAASQELYQATQAANGGSAENPGGGPTGEG